MKSGIKKHCRMWKMMISDTKSQHEKPSLTTPDIPILPILEIPPLLLRTTKSDFYIWPQTLVHALLGLLLLLLFFNGFLKFFKARVNFCGFYWSQLLGSLRTLTGLHRGFFSIIVLSPTDAARSPLAVEITFKSY